MPSTKNEPPAQEAGARPFGFHGDARELKKRLKHRFVA